MVWIFLLTAVLAALQLRSSRSEARTGSHYREFDWAKYAASATGAATKNIFSGLVRSVAKIFQDDVHMCLDL